MPSPATFMERDESTINLLPKGKQLRNKEQVYKTVRSLKNISDQSLVDFNRRLVQLDGQHSAMSKKYAFLRFLDLLEKWNVLLDYLYNDPNSTSDTWSVDHGVLVFDPTRYKPPMMMGFTSRLTRLSYLMRFAGRRN